MLKRTCSRVVHNPVTPNPEASDVLSYAHCGSAEVLKHGPEGGVVQDQRASACLIGKCLCTPGVATRWIGQASKEVIRAGREPCVGHKGALTKGALLVVQMINDLVDELLR